METTQILETVEQVFRKILKAPALPLKLEHTPKDIAGWDSLVHIMLLSELGKRFGVKFSTAEMLKMDKISSICETVKSKLD